MKAKIDKVLKKQGPRLSHAGAFAFGETVATRLARHQPLEISGVSELWGDSTPMDWFDYVNTPGIYLFNLPDKGWRSMPMLIVTDEKVSTDSRKYVQVGNYFTLVDLPGWLVRYGFRRPGKELLVYDEYWDDGLSGAMSGRRSPSLMREIVEGVYDYIQPSTSSDIEQLRVKKIIQPEPSFICLNWTTIPQAIF